MQPGQPDLQMIMQQAQKMQEQLIAAQAELATAEVTGQAGNGLVQVTMTAAGEVRAVRIDPQVVDPEDVDTLPPSSCRPRRWARWRVASGMPAGSACPGSRLPGLKRV